MNIPASPTPAVKRRNPHLYAQSLETHSVASNSKPEQAVCHEPLGQEQGKAPDSAGCLVSITSFRRRLLDPDNLVGGVKYFVDSLRYANAIPGDRPDQIRLTVQQRKVAHKSEERTEISIEYP